MKKLVLVSLLALACIVPKAFAQDLFELQFTGKDGTKYKGLLVLFSDTKMYMRVAYFSDDVYRVVQVDYTSKQGETDAGENYLALIGSNPVFITDAGNRSYRPDHLIFYGEESLPYITDTPEDPEQTLLADGFKTIKQADVTESYLRQFYGEKEDDYIALRKMFGYEPVAFENTNYATPVTLHLVIVANTDISDIGPGCTSDERSMISEFRGIADALNVTYKQYLVDGSGFNKTNVLNTLNNDLNPGSNDIVVFIYRGHGFRWTDQSAETEFWPMMDMRASAYTPFGAATSLGLAEVYQIVKGKGARLNIILGDCCNSDVGMAKITDNNYLSAQSNNNLNVAKLKQLFINTKGDLLSCAASPGEYSWVNASGGFYTTSFIQALRDEISFLREDDADWKDLITNTINNANTKIKLCNNCSPQTGRYYYGIK